MSSEGWSAAEGDPQEYIEKLKDQQKYAAARRSIAKNAKDIDDEFKLLQQLDLM